MKTSKSILGLVALMVIAACTKPDEILNDFQVNINPTFYKYVIEVEVQDIAAPDDEFTANLDISIEGEDAAAIYSIDGTRNYALNYGIIQLMVAKTAEPTESDPLDFTINVGSSDYQEVSLPVSIEKESYFQEYELGLLNLNNLPGGVTNKKKSQTMDPTKNTLSAPLVLSTGSEDSTSRVQLTIPDDVQFLDADGNVITAKSAASSLEVSVLSLSDTSESAQRALPSGGGMVQKVNVGGQEENVLLDATATFEISMNLDGVPVKSFKGGKNSGGVKARIPVPGHMVNPETQAAYAEGDSLSMMSFSHGDAAWQTESGSYVVVKDPASGELFAEPAIDHLSHWRYWYRWRWWRNSRPSPNRYKFTGHLKNANGGSINGLMILRSRYTRSWYGYNRYFWLRGSFTDQGYRHNPARYFSYYNASLSSPTVIYQNFGSSFTTSVLTSNDGTRQIFDVEIDNPNRAPRVGYKLYCKGNNALVSPPAGVKMYYRKTAEGGQYYHLHTFTTNAIGNNQLVPMPKLEDGEIYDFRARFGDVEKDTANVQVVDGKFYTVTLPKAACDKLF